MLAIIQNWRSLTTLFLVVFLFFSYHSSKNIGADTQQINKKKRGDSSRSSAALKPLLALDYYTDIFELPLFEASRQAVPKVVKRRVISVGSQGELRVKGLGMAVGPDGLITVLKDLRNGKIVKLKLNDSLNGWVLSEISREGFLFLKDQRRQWVKYRESQD